MSESIFFVVLVLTSASAAGTDAFDQRATIANTLEVTPQGRAYDQVLYAAIGGYMQKAMMQCFPRGAKVDVEHFTLVADILASGTAARVQVRPDTGMTACFAEKFRTAPFPGLPIYVSTGVLPIVIHMKIAP